MWLIAIFVTLCFILPGGPAAALFFFLILFPEILLLYCIVEYWRSQR